MKRIILLTAFISLTAMQIAQSQNTDTVVIELAHSSKVVFTIGDKKDLQQLRRYDFQGLFNDILDNLEANDTLHPLHSIKAQDTDVDEEDVDTTEISNAQDSEDEENEDNEEDEDNEDDHHWADCGSCHSRTHASFNFDFGINNFLEDGGFPDDHGAQYAVHPWGSWYVGANTILHADIGRHVFFEFGLGVSWYNFKFQDDNTLITKGENGVGFSKDQRTLDFNVSKLTATYLNASFIPMYATGRHHHHSRWNYSDHDSFRIGVGPYAGYRLESHSKQGYTIDGDKQSDKVRDNFYLNNFRYGVRLQMGLESIDFFAAYDLNSFFVEGKGPKLNAFTIGVVF
ncbi:MAG: hypothetical protein WAT91_15315 [Saprospiraceae bacterium]